MANPFRISSKCADTVSVLSSKSKVMESTIKCEYEDPSSEVLGCEIQSSYGTMYREGCLSCKAQPVFLAIFRGLFLLEVRILPAAHELREAYVFSPHLTYTSQCELNQS